MKKPLERRTVQAVDTETGEVVDGLPIYFQAKVRWHEDFFMGIQKSFERLAVEPRMTFEARRVLDFCLSRMGFENHIHVPQEEIAEMLKMRQPHVSRAFKLLVEIGVLIEGPKIGRSKSYRLNSRYGWKGKIHHLSDRRLQERSDRRKNGEEPAPIHPMGGLFAEEGAVPPAPSKLDNWIASNREGVKTVVRKNPVEDEPQAAVMFNDGMTIEIVGWMDESPVWRFLSPDEAADYFGPYIR